MAAEGTGINPSHIPLRQFVKNMGNTINEVLEYVNFQIERMEKRYGKNEELSFYFTSKPYEQERKKNAFRAMMRELDWDEEKSNMSGIW